MLLYFIDWIYFKFYQEKMQKANTIKLMIAQGVSDLKKRDNLNSTFE